MSTGNTLTTRSTGSESAQFSDHASQNSTIPVDVVIKGKQRQRTEAPRLTTANLESALRSIENRWNDLGTELRFPQALIQEIETQNLSVKERLTAVIKHFLQLHPFASWRRIIRASERLEEHSLVKHIKTYAERILDPSLTVDNVVRVILATTGDWADGVYAYGLAGELLVPITVQDKLKRRYSSVQDQKVALAKYWLRIVFNASWPTLMGTLYFLNEKAALEICVKNYLDQDKDESLTFENLLAAFEGVTKWQEIGYRLRIPTGKQNEIRSLYQTDEQRKEAVIKEFIEHHPVPTWKEAALALYRMRHHNLVKDLYDRKYLIAPEEQRLLDIFNYTVRQKGSLNQTIMQATIQGNARSGKTSLIKVLQGKSANPAEPSTAVMEESARIELNQSAVLVEGVLWTPIEDLHEEATLVVREVMTAEQVQTSETLSTIDDGYISTDTPGLSTYETDIYETSMSDIQLPTTSGYESIESQRKLFSEQELENSTISNIFKLAIKKAKLEMTIIKDPWTLYISDVGGQLEFQELVPALTNGPSLHIIVIAAHWGLNNKCPVEYLHKNGTSALSYKANYTVKENVLLTLATIMSTGRHKHKPKAIFIMTFKDLVSEQELLQMNEDLLLAVKPTEAYRSGVIELSAPNNLCHFINNLKPDKEDIAKIRKTVERIGQRNDDYQVRTPYTWLCFSLALRGMKEKVLQYSTCVEAGKQCGIETLEELNAALHFLHYNIGVIRHFSDVPELTDIVIKEPQILFDCVTELVVNTFTFERVNCSTHEDFQKKGLFPAEMVNKLSTDSDILTVEKFVAFLMYHHIIAPLEEDGEAVKYFLPCSLVHAEILEELACFDSVPSLIVTFDTGYTPRGIFGFLVSDLLTEKGHDLQVVLDVDCIYRDQLTVSVGPYVDKFCFSLHPMYIKIDVEPSAIKRQLPLGLICCYVRKRVVDALVEIVDKLNYNSKAKHSLAFFCPKQCNDQIHPATISYYQGEVQAMKCIISKTAKSLPEGHEFWFNEATKWDIFTNRKRPAADFPVGCPKRVEYDLELQHSYSANNCPIIQEMDTLTQDPLTVNQLQVIRVSIWKARGEWEKLGTALHVDHSTLKAIAMKHRDRTEECFTEMLYSWLCREHPPPTLVDLKRSLSALSSLQEMIPNLKKELDNCLDHDTHCLATSLAHANKSNQPLTNDHLKLVIKVLWKARVNWFDIGLVLLNDVPTLESIRTKHGCNPDDCLHSMLSCWLSKGHSTLEDLKKSVESLPVRENYPKLGKDLMKQFKMCTCPDLP